MKYRSEIDGLRAVAVIPVILFHAGLDTFKGGYIGVDVFFVISGYLITSIVVREISDEKFSLIHFYERRARRILPALFSVVLCCIPLAWLWMYPSELEEFSRSLIAVNLFASNIEFWLQGSYFSTSIEIRPLFHTWSLAVEEQFYLLFPLALLLLMRLRHNRVVLLLALIAAVSLFFAELGWRFYPTANFYLAPMRAWELLGGSLCAFAQFPSGQKTNDALGLAGILLIAFAVFSFNEDTPFPSLYTLIPVLGTILIILFAAEGTLVARALSVKFLVGLGLISYSAYLWHQPLFAFARIRSLHEVSVEAMLGLSVLSVIFGYLSWQFIEKPFRARGPIAPCSPKKLVWLSIITSFLIVGIAVAFMQGLIQPRASNNLTAMDKHLLSFKDYSSEAKILYKQGTCFLRPEQTFDQFADECTSVPDKTPSIVIWGDSHAAALSYGLREIFPSAMQLTASACPPLAGLFFGRRLHCKEINDWTLDFIRNERPDYVLLGSNWLRDVRRIDYLRNTVRRIKEANAGTKIIILGGLPQWNTPVPEQIIKQGIDTREDKGIFNENRRVLQVDNTVSQIAKSESAKFISLLEIACASDRCQALVKQDGALQPFAWDKSHLTAGGSVWLAKRLEKRIFAR